MENSSPKKESSKLVKTIASIILSAIPISLSGCYETMTYYPSGINHSNPNPVYITPRHYSPERRIYVVPKQNPPIIIHSPQSHPQSPHQYNPDNNQRNYPNREINRDHSQHFNNGPYGNHSPRQNQPQRPPQNNRSESNRGNNSSPGQRGSQGQGPRR
jgi:hypothetical protein